MSTEPAARRFTLRGKRWVVATIGVALLAGVMAIRHQQANARLAGLDQRLCADVDRHILPSNLFGMDLDAEAS